MSYKAIRASAVTAEGADARLFDSFDDESLLVQGLRHGDERACEQMIRLYGGRMLSVARRLLRSEHDAADAVQDACLSAFRHCGSFGGNSSLWTWLHRIVVNAALMRIRSQRRLESIEPLLPTFDETGHHARPVLQWFQDAAQHASTAELRAQVRAAIDRLPEIYRTVLLLRDIEELNTEEAARRLGCSIGNVKTRLHRARQALRTLLEPIYGVKAFASDAERSAE